MTQTRSINYTYWLLNIIVILICLVLQSCGGGGDPTPAPAVETDAQKNQKIMVAAPWTMQTVTVDGIDKTSVYSGLKITFTNTAFTSTNGKAIWPDNGTWKFKDDSGKAFDRNDGLTVTVSDIQSSKLVLTLIWSKTTLGPGRDASVSGQHVFTFSK